ncbi:MAG: class I SAM-dependent methyltransferase [Myxococcales bacterium]|nr:class I SAM-dependent methyltransferase [Myxococcales bacterium]
MQRAHFDVQTWGEDETSDAYAKLTEVHTHHRWVNMYGSLKHLGDVNGKRVLDLPSGEGKYSLHLLSRGAAHVTSVDLAAKMIELTASRLTGAQRLRWHGVVADAGVRQAYAAQPFDASLSNFIFEYCADVEALRRVASNLFLNLADGGRCVITHAPGAELPEDRAHVIATVNIHATELTPAIAPGDLIKIRYPNCNLEYEWYYWPTDAIAEALASVGFADISIHRVELDPSYHGDVDLRRFAAHTGNRHITASKPAP